MSPVPLALNAEVATPDGVRFRWGANEDPGDRPQNLSFRTKLGEGFSDASLQLPRRIDQDYPDLSLVNEVIISGEDGTVAYEGRLSAMPRELTDSHAVNVQLAGWMAHAKDRKFAEIYIDRDLGAWQEASRGRRLDRLTANIPVLAPSQATDPTDSAAGVSTVLEGTWASPYQPLAEAWYDAGSGLTIGKIGYSWKREGAGSTAPWTWQVVVASNDKASASQATANLVAAGPSTGQVFTPSVSYRYALLQTTYGATPGGVDGGRYGVSWYKLAVYGSHGLLTNVGEPGEPAGVYASDVIRDIALRFCPMLNTGSVGDTSYVIQHLAFKDRVFPYDAFLEVNKYHLWHLGVWEARTLHFRPYNLTDYKWEVRTDDPGINISLQGDSTDDLFNGVAVTYTDLLTGVRTVLTPDVFSDLKDDDPDNPWTRQGINHWDELELSAPTLQGQALKIGMARLEAVNRPKAPGTITVTGYVRDRAGNPQPAWRVRAGDTITISNFPNDRPRLIHETSYDDSSKALTITVEGPAQQMDAVFDRITNALQAKGLTS